MKNKLLTIAFMVMLCGTFVINLFVKDVEVSNTERRTLMQFPEVSVESILSGDWMDDFEDYANDQFVGRDFMGSVQSFMRNVLLQQKDTNGLFMKDGVIYKMDYKVNEGSVRHFVEVIESIQSMFSEDNKMYLAIIPDKNYYLEDDDHLRLDYDKIYAYIDENLDVDTIDLRDCLSSESYYRTDLHYRQEYLDLVVNRIAEHYDVEIEGMYQSQSYDKFYGAYAGQWGQKVEPDTLVYLENDILKEAIVTNLEKPSVTSIYDTATLTGMDSYDVFLSGATAFTVIENPKATTDKELIIFRDSFGSSLAPLLVEAYQKITLVDARYMYPSMITEYMTIENQDVLFLYSIPVINNSQTLRK
ncbi:MAG: hypothetical protein IJO78_06350 [Erysipelotrichaceae bacterium]|nr:hypothetical protein [Erysipelotrichaceae bacterium]